jgi:hypothetical protein
MHRVLGSLVLMAAIEGRPRIASLAGLALAQSESGTVYLASLLDSAWSSPQLDFRVAMGLTGSYLSAMAVSGRQLPPAARRSVAGAFCGILALVDATDASNSPVARLQGELARRDTLSAIVVQGGILRLLVDGGDSREASLALRGLEEAAAGSEYFRAVLEEFEFLESRRRSQ